MIGRNDPCWCGSGKKWKKCHYPTENKTITFEQLKNIYKNQYNIILKTTNQINGIRNSSKLAASILRKLCDFAKEDVSTNEINDYAVSLHKEANAIPAPLNYGNPPFPKAICTSLNEVICHGIPDETKLKLGDILNIDVTCILNGYYGDCSAMVEIGDVDDEKKNVVKTSRECLIESIKILKPGVLIKEIGAVIEKIAKKNHCSVVNQFVGHGVGINFHEEPQIPHYKNNIDTPLKEGMIFTIEPMINAGVVEGKIDTVDHWTTRTIDKKPSAQWEHTILITQDKHEILTL